MFPKYGGALWVFQRHAKEQLEHCCIKNINH
jgi:hypothetical protein